MDLTTRSIEQFVAGAEEIDRKREVIKRVLGTVTRFLHVKSRIKWNNNETIALIPLKGPNGPKPKGSIRLASRWVGKDGTVRKVAVEFQAQDCSWRYRGYKDADVPHKLVSVVYEHLPSVVEAADEVDPTAGIAEHFQFFINQAPDA